MKNNVLFLVIVLLLILGGGYVYMKNQASMNPSSNQTQQTVSQAPNKVKEITMTAKKFQFDPSEITVKQGETVRLKITSLDVTHGFSLPDFNIDQQLEAGKEVTVEFVPDKKGTFTFSCSVMCGAEHRNMKGTLTVE